MSFNYAARDPLGWCGDPKRGAALGRDDLHVDDKYRELPRRFYVRRVKLTKDGYDSCGTYWGCGQPLWVAQDYDQEVEMFRRFETRDEMKALISELYPKATFCR